MMEKGSKQALTHRMTNNDNTTFEQRLQQIYSSSLEAWVHEILYIRRLYPKEAFRPTYLSSATTTRSRIFVCQHPGTAKYIQKVLHDVTVPTLLQTSHHIHERKQGNEIVVELYCPRRKIVYEQFFLSLSALPSEDDITSGGMMTSSEYLHVLDIDFRDLICNGVRKLEKIPSHSQFVTSTSVSFRILLKKTSPAVADLVHHTTRNIHQQTPTTSISHDNNNKLQEMISKGKWKSTSRFVATDTSNQSQQQPQQQQNFDGGPLKKIVFSSSSIGFQFYCRILEDDNIGETDCENI